MGTRTDLCELEQQCSWSDIVYVLDSKSNQPLDKVSMSYVMRLHMIRRSTFLLGSLQWLERLGRWIAVSWYITAVSGKASSGGNRAPTLKFSGHNRSVWQIKRSPKVPPGLNWPIINYHLAFHLQQWHYPSLQSHRVLLTKLLHIEICKWSWP
jgi:hypothetical protein